VKGREKEKRFCNHTRKEISRPSNSDDPERIDKYLSLAGSGTMKKNWKMHLRGEMAVQAKKTKNQKAFEEILWKEN